MDRKTILALVLSVVVILLWQTIFWKDKDKHQTKQTAVQSVAKQEEKKEQTEKSSTAPVAPTDRQPEKIVTLQDDLFSVAFTTRGASAKKIAIKRYSESGKSSPTEARRNIVTTEREEELPFRIHFREENTSFQLPAWNEWTVLEQESNRVKFGLIAPSADFPEITKEFRLGEREYTLDLVIEINNRSEKSQREQILVDVFGGKNMASGSGCMGDQTIPRTAACFANGEYKAVGTDPGSLVQLEPSIWWAGINEQYFLLAAVNVGEKKAVCRLEKRKSDETLSASLMYEEKNIPPGGSAIHSLRLFTGPKDFERMRAVSGGPLENDRETHLDRSIDYGWVSFVAVPLLWLLKVLYAFAGNFGVAIVLLTIVVRVVLLPLNQKSMVSMKGVAKLQPAIEELKKKYAGDSQRMNQEVMSLYKTHKVSPLGGCLPMLLQMPIWFGLYRAIGFSIDLYQAVFIPGWIEDLSAYDPTYILPIVLGVGMFLQQKMTPSTMDSQQAKIMLYFMPVMFTVIMLRLPSGLVLYIMMSTIVGIAHQVLFNRWYTRKTQATQPGGA